MKDFTKKERKILISFEHVFVQLLVEVYNINLFFLINLHVDLLHGHFHVQQRQFFHCFGLWLIDERLLNMFDLFVLYQLLLVQS
jgi:hypothetical protein